MLRRFAATAACVLALDYFFSHAPLPGPSNASAVSAAMAARSATPPSVEMFTLRAKYEGVPDDLTASMAVEPAAPKAIETESDSIFERAGKSAKAAVNVVRDLAGTLTKDDPLMDPGLDMRPAPVVWPKLTREETCNAIEFAALEHDLPTEFLGRLIWQESRHNARAISPAGARGIAQFMPGTAADIGLRDPFDPVASLLKSAKFLRRLHDKFGNVGLAAAAYNGGPGRLARWLEAWEKTAKKKRKPALPLETQNYVRIITGKPVTEWIGVKGEKAAELKQTRTVPCIPESPVIQAKAKTPEKPEKPVKVASLDGPIPVPAAALAWNVQVIGAWSEQKAQEQFAALKKKYPAMLGARRPSVFRAKLAKGGQATFIRIAAATQTEGQELCGKLKETGGSCSVQKNTSKTASKS